MEKIEINNAQNEILGLSDNKLPDKSDQRLHEIKVLMYHRLIDDEEAKVNHHWTNVSQQDFREHLKILETFNYTPITFIDLHLHLRGEIELPKKPVIITFDDAYEDFYTLGYPVLKEYGARAVIFALGDFSIRENIWDDPKIIKRVPLMSKQQLLEIDREGFEIGAHSCTHPKLTELDSNELYKEIFNSKRNLEDLLNKEVLSFCYPYGLENEKVRNVVKEAGFTFGCGVYNGPLRFGESLFNIHRITIKNGMGGLSLALRMLTPFNYVETKGAKIKKKIRNRD